MYLPPELWKMILEIKKNNFELVCKQCGSLKKDCHSIQCSECYKYVCNFRYWTCDICMHDCCYKEVLYIHQEIEFVMCRWCFDNFEMQ